MRCRGIVSLLIVLLAVLGFGLTAPTVAFAQATAGVIVDAEGVLRTKTAADAEGQLTKERINAARAALNPKLAAFSRLRYVSLKHLEKAIEENHGVATEEMQNLAGLLRLRYVFLYPESKDIVIAGPAEGWVTDGFGRFVGLKSGRPTIQLQDLVVALRAFPSDGPATKFIGCSIDPTPEGLAAMQQFAAPVRLSPRKTPPTLRGGLLRVCRRASACRRSASTASPRGRISPSSWSRPIIA